MLERDIVALNQLAYRYAAAVDACDVDAFASVFTEDGRLHAFQPYAQVPFADMTGHEQLAAVPNSMRQRYRATAHMMTNHLVEIDGDRASGQVLCSARHLNIDPSDDNVLVVMIRYIDRYARTAQGWRIADREIRFLWHEQNKTVDGGIGSS